MQLIKIGHVGSDAGYYYWDGHQWHHVGGWGIDQLTEVRSALNIMSEATRLKTPGLAEAATKTVAEFVQKQLSTYVKQTSKAGETVVIIT